jgi:hypothetical protein
MPTPPRKRLSPEKQVDCPCPGSMARGVYIHAGQWAVTACVRCGAMSVTEAICEFCPAGCGCPPSPSSSRRRPERGLPSAGPAVAPDVCFHGPHALALFEDPIRGHAEFDSASAVGGPPARRGPSASNTHTFTRSSQNVALSSQGVTQSPQTVNKLPRTFTLSSQSVAFSSQAVTATSNQVALSS